MNPPTAQPTSAPAPTTSRPPTDSAAERFRKKVEALRRERLEARIAAVSGQRERAAAMRPLVKAVNDLIEAGVRPWVSLCYRVPGEDYRTLTGDQILPGGAYDLHFTFVEAGNIRVHYGHASANECPPIASAQYYWVATVPYSDADRALDHLLGVLAEESAPM